MASNNEHLNVALQKFERATKNPERYISSQLTHETALTSCTQTLFGLAASHAEANLKSSNPLSELITEGFDEEQIWQELELQNQPCLGSLVKHVAKAIAGRNRLCLQTLTEQDVLGESDDDQDEEGDFDDDDDEQDMEEEEEEEALIESEDEQENPSHTSRTKKSNKASKDSDESDESDTNFDIDELHSRTKPEKKVSKSKPSAQKEDKGGKGKASVVDDQFFRLGDMERFLEMEDAKEAKRVRQMDRGNASDDEEDEDEEDDEEPVDFFDDASSDDGGFDDEDDEEEDEVQVPHKQDKKSTRDMMYQDFFAEPGAEMATTSSKKKVHFEGEEGGEEMEEDGNEKDFEEEGFEEADFEDADDDLLEDLRKASANKDDLLLSGSESEGEEISDILGGQRKKGEDKSTFEKRQEKLRNKIGELEDSNLAKKPWQLIGEVGGIKRPENSLLEERLEFDVRTRPAPVITEETTITLESLIKQRALDQAWDDVQRKAKPKEEVKEFKKRVTLDQEKSKMSLGEIYEQEYIKQTREEAEEEKEDPLHKEIKESMDALFIKLDALSNFHFSPKPIGPEVKIVSHTPAISMEEVTPVSVAESSLLAPEEIKEKEKGELKGKTEKTSTDRNRDLRKKKLKQRAKAQDKERKERMVEKLKPGLGNKYSKKAALARLEKNSKAPSSTTTIVKDMDNAKGNLKSSKAFFSKLQEEVAAEVHGFKTKKKKKKVMTGTQLKL